jgi:hypothetical protein
MHKLIQRGLMAATALAIPAGALLVSPLAAHASTPAPLVKVVTDCHQATAGGSEGYTDGCHFTMLDGNGHFTNFTNYSFTDVCGPLGEVETQVGIAPNSIVPNNTGKFVTYTATHTPGFPNQTALSFVTGRTTTDWSMTIAPNGMWSLVATFNS